MQSSPPALHLLPGGKLADVEAVDCLLLEKLLLAAPTDLARGTRQKQSLGQADVLDLVEVAIGWLHALELKGVDLSNRVLFH